MSDGQRRRVQIFLGLIRPFKILLLDEVRWPAWMTRSLCIQAPQPLCPAPPQTPPPGPLPHTHLTHTPPSGPLPHPPTPPPGPLPPPQVTVSLDVVVRQDLLRWLRRESETRGATILYATHIFDGLDDWPTHLHYLCNKVVREGTGWSSIW